MSYNSSIPQISDFISLSQKQMLANYRAIFSAFAEDHVSLGLDAQGQHDSLTLRVQNSDPATASDQIAVYSKLVTNVPQMFFRPSSNQTSIQMTNSNLNTPIGATQSTFIPGPFTISMGILFNCTTGTVVTLQVGLNIKYVSLTMILTGPNIPTIGHLPYATNIVGNQFTVTFGALANNPIIYYTAIS